MEEVEFVWSERANQAFGSLFRLHFRNKRCAHIRQTHRMPWLSCLSAICVVGNFDAPESTRRHNIQIKRFSLSFSSNAAYCVSHETPEHALLPLLHEAFARRKSPNLHFALWYGFGFHTFIHTHTHCTRNCRRRRQRQKILKWKIFKIELIVRIAHHLLELFYSVVFNCFPSPCRCIFLFHWLASFRFSKYYYYCDYSFDVFSFSIWLAWRVQRVCTLQLQQHKWQLQKFHTFMHLLLLLWFVFLTHLISFIFLIYTNSFPHRVHIPRDFSRYYCNEHTVTLRLHMQSAAGISGCGLLVQLTYSIQFNSNSAVSFNAVVR